MDESSTSTNASSGAPPTSSGANASATPNPTTTPPSPSYAPEGLPIRPPLLALICLIGGLLLHMLSSGPREIFAHHVLGLLIAAGGTGLCFYAAALFQAHRTTKNPQGEATTFVTEMPYTFTRNPMYLGLTLILFGLAVFYGSIAMLLGPIVFVVIIDRIVVPLEEHNMQRLFGAQYSDYQTRVRRWL
jgi:protein-S-isoprenylcysteine O-methyltransferase Ste14